MTILTATGSAGMGSMLITLVLMLAVFYFMLIRPENKRKKEAEQMRSSVKTGDKITTIGGIDINSKNQVVDANKKPTPGLYSAGVESCTLYRETYNYQLSGGMNAYNFFSGRNAVKNALGLSW